MSIFSSIFGSEVVSQACNVLTVVDTTTKVGKTFSKRKKLINWIKFPIKIAVYGSSGSGKSSFLASIKGSFYEGNTTRGTQVIKYRLPNGRLIHFYDSPGQTSYRSERNQIKNKILNREFHAIINVVCFGYNESEGMKMKIFDKNDKVDEKYLEENRRLELEHLREWVDDIDVSSKLKWILTIINKEDIWSAESGQVLTYYSESEYYRLLEKLERVCKLHIMPYCSKIALFGGRPMTIGFEEKDKIERHRDLIENIIQYIEKS